LRLVDAGNRGRPFLRLPLPVLFCFALGATLGGSKRFGGHSCVTVAGLLCHCCLPRLSWGAFNSVTAVTVGALNSVTRVTVEYRLVVVRRAAGRMDDVHVPPALQARDRALHRPLGQAGLLYQCGDARPRIAGIAV